MTVLIVENNTQYQQLIIKAFDRQYPEDKTYLAENIQQAKILIENNEIDFIVADYDLPDGSGIDLIKTEGTSVLPVIILISPEDTINAEKVMKAGAREYVEKSVEMLDSIPEVVRCADREWQEMQKRKKAEIALEKSYQSFHDIFNHFQDSVYIQDKEGRFVDVNLGAQKMYGYPREYFLGKTPEILSAPGKNDLNQLGNMIQSAFDEKPQRFEFWGIRKNGEVFPKEVTLNLSKYHGQDVLIAIGTEITERIQSQKKLAEAYKTIEQGNHLFVQGPVILFQWSANKDDPVQYVSDNVFNILGYSVKDFISGSILYKDIVHGDDVNRVFQEGIHFAELDVESFEHRPYRLVAKSGKIIWVSDYTSIIKNKSGIVDKYLGYVLDISSRMEAEISREKALGKAEQADSVKNQFMANMSHEIRTPLNTIIGTADLLERNLNKHLSEDDKMFFSAIRQSGERLVNTMHEILDISQIMSGTFDTRPVNIDLIALLNKIANDLQMKAENKGNKIQVESELEKVIIIVDEYCLEHALNIFISNAVQYTENGIIRIKLFKQKGLVMIEISDTGIGISSKYLKNIFDPFSQESSGYTKKYQGIGLGLALAKRFLELNKISIEVESNKGIGTSILLKINADQTENFYKIKDSKSNTSENLEVDGKPEHPLILVVEDDVNTQRMIQFFLKKQYEVICVKTSPSALKVLTEKTPSVIILDVNLLGGQDGLDLARKIREEKKWNNIPIIAATAHDTNADQEACISAGCDDFIAKPIRQKTLNEKLVIWIDQ